MLLFLCHAKDLLLTKGHTLPKTLVCIQALMRSSNSAGSSANLEGILRESSSVREEVIDRAPPADSRSLQGRSIIPPQASLKPSHFTSNWQRYAVLVIATLSMIAAVDV